MLGEDLAESRLVLFHRPVVIPRRDELVAVRHRPHPSGEVPDLRIPAAPAEVPGMDEDIGLGHRMVHPLVHPVSVAEEGETEAWRRHGSILSAKLGLVLTTSFE